MDEDESPLESENNNGVSEIETMKTETTGDRILYDGIVDDAGEQLLHPSIEMFGDFENCVKGEYAHVEVDYNDPSPESVAVLDDTNGAAVVTYNPEEYYETEDSITYERKHDCDLDQFSSDRATKNNNNNDDDADPAVKEEEEEANETITLQVDEKSAFIVLANNNFGADYVEIESGSHDVAIAIEK